MSPLLSAGDLTRTGPIRRAGLSQPVPLLDRPAGLARAVEVVARPDPLPVLPGEGRDDVDVVVSVSDRDPAHRLFVAPRGEPDAVDVLGGDVGPLLVRELPVLICRGDGQVVDRPGRLPVLALQTGREQRAVQRGRQQAQVPPAAFGARRFETVGAVPPGDQARLGLRGGEAVLAGQPFAKQVAEQPSYVTAALTDLPDHEVSSSGGQRAGSPHRRSGQRGGRPQRRGTARPVSRRCCA